MRRRFWHELILSFCILRGCVSGKRMPDPHAILGIHTKDCLGVIYLYLSPKNLPIFSNLLCGTFRGRPPPREFREAQIAEIFPFVSRQAHGSEKSNSQPLMSTISTIPLNLTPNPSRQPSQPSSPLSWADDCSNCSLKTWSG